MNRFFFLIGIVGLFVGSDLALAEKKPIPKSESYDISEDYVHAWIPFPTITGKYLLTKEDYKYQTKRGYVTVLIFLASWCIPCQKILDEFVKSSQEFDDLHTKFIFAFMNDTEKDALGFAKEYEIGGDLIIADKQLKTEFHNPELPTVYIADRHGNLAKRFRQMKSDDLRNFKRTLKLATAF